MGVPERSLASSRSAGSGVVTPSGHLANARDPFGGTVRVDVEDNGVGIEAEHQAVIFDKFRQVGDTLTQKPAGTGLGLAICREIVAHLGGRLWVRSEPGRGSTFSFTLPVAAATRAVATA